jgi:hypothetical protein
MQDSPRLFRVELTLDEVEALPEWEGERTEGGMIGSAPIGERADQEPMTTD